MVGRLLLYGFFRPVGDDDDGSLFRFDGASVAETDGVSFSVTESWAVLQPDGSFVREPVTVRVAPMILSDLPASLVVRDGEFTAEISAPGLFGSTSVVEVYKPGDFCGSLGPSKINWSACGAQSPAVTGVFAQALQLAVLLAANYDRAAGLVGGA